MSALHPTRRASPPASDAAVGNDVVDLRDPDARPETLHPRFDAKAFDAGERAYIGAGPGANPRRWSLWAAKEAAHKALRQEAPELGFAPRHYHVELDARGCGSVSRGADAIAVRVEANEEQVHALAFRGEDGDLHAVVASLRELGETDPGLAVRALLQRSVGRPGPLQLERRERIPRLRLAGQTVPVSFSHHGRFVAVARRAGSA